MGMLMARGCAERGRATGRTVTAVPTISYSVGVQRYRGSSSRVRKTEKNLAYQPARDPLIWAAYMPRNVGPLGVTDIDIIKSITSANTSALTKYRCLSWKTELVTPCCHITQCCAVMTF